MHMRADDEMPPQTPHIKGEMKKITQQESKNGMSLNIFKSAHGFQPVYDLPVFHT
jgi:hypothetical protein